MEEHKPNTIYGTTILSVRKDNEVVIVGDGQVTLGNSVMKGTAKKIRELNDGKILTGFAGSTADAFALFERLEQKLQRHPDNLTRACLELAKDWRTDKYLRHLEAMMIVVDKDITLIISGNGDVIEPEGGIAAIGSGGNYALSAAKALYDIDNMDAETICKKAMQIAGDLCIYTNHNLTIKKIKTSKTTNKTTNKIDSKAEKDTEKKTKKKTKGKE